MLQNDGNILIEKLDEFIRRYYKNQLVKGILYSAGILLAAFLSVTFLEYLAEFNSAIRGILFFGFLGAVGFVLGKYIVLPLLKLNKIGARISYEQAADIIGKHFGNVQDKLLNVLQLQNNRLTGASNDLLLASIHQKIEELRPVPFAAAIDIQQNRRYLPYVLPLVLVTALVAIVWPHVFSKSTSRLVHYQTYFEKEMPFSFTIQNSSLKALQTEDFDLQVKVGGSEIPNEVHLLVNGIEYKLDKENQFQFHYNFSNLQANTKFQFAAAGFLSKEYEIEVLPKPTLLEFGMLLSYPAYLHKADELVSNAGDLQLPQGTKVKWQFHTRNTDRLQLVFADSTVSPSRNNDDNFSYTRRILHDETYGVKATNKVVGSGDSVQYSIHVIPDQYPQIEVTEKTDSLDNRQIYFSGNVRDDYGFSQLNFIYSRTLIDSLGKTTEEHGSMPISLGKDNVSQNFFYYVDISRFALNLGERIDYFFEVKDNDGVNGPKSARSSLLSFKAPSRAELAESRDKNNSEIQKDLEESIAKAKQLQKDINELSKKINDKKQLNYEDQKKLEDLLKKQQSLQSKIEEIKQENQVNNQQQNEFSQTDENILEKQKELEKLFENVMTPEMKKLFDELQKMMDKLDKNQIQEKLDELKLNNKDIEKELDRNLELFRQLEVQQKMQEAIDKLDELQKRQEELSKESLDKKEEKPIDKDNSDKTKNDEKSNENKDANKSANEKDNKVKDDKAKDDKAKDNADNKDKKSDAAELNKKQEELNKEFEALKKDLQDLKEKNKQLEEPTQMPETQKAEEQISQDMQNSSSQLQKNNKKSAAQSQKSASEKMEQMKEQMEQAMEEEEQEQNEENAQALRQLLENLLQLSFSQEELIADLGKTRVDNPQFVSIPQRQSKLKDDSKIIEDSLFALSKRVPDLSALVNREIALIHSNMDKTVKALAERNTSEGSMRMQRTMTSVNNLALKLSEALDQMQNQQKQSKQSKGKKAGKCKKPGSGVGQKPSNKGSSSANMRKMQEQLNKQLQEMKDAMEKGQKPGDKPGDKKGDKPGQGKPGGMGNGMTGSSEQFAKMAAQQEALRRQMQGLMDKLKKEGKNPGGNLASLMEETEKDLVNKRLTNETMKRQQEILTRLLESEKAEQEREQDEQRKSKEAKNENLSNPDRFLEYKRTKEKEMELLNTVPPGLNSYYKEKVNLYFNSVKQ